MISERWFVKDILKVEMEKTFCETCSVKDVLKHVFWNQNVEFYQKLGGVIQ